MNHEQITIAIQQWVKEQQLIQWYAQIIVDWRGVLDMEGGKQ